MTKIMLKERRASKRIPFASPIRYQCKASKKFDNSLVRDISNTGIGFYSDEFFPLSTHLILELQNPVNYEFMRVVGEVVWVSNQTRDERYSIGAKFIDPPTLNIEDTYLAVS